MELLSIDVPKPVDASLRFRLSFRPFVDYLQKQIETTSLDSGTNYLYEYILEKFSPYLTLLQPVEEVVIQPLEPLFALIKASIFPLAQQENAIPYAIGLPGNQLNLFHYSEAFAKLLAQFADSCTDLPPPINREDSLRVMYQLILEKCYDLSPGKKPLPLLTFEKSQNGVTKYYRLRIDFQFLVPHSAKQLPPLQPAWLEFANYNRKTVNELPIALPLEQFTFDGFCLFTIEDITEEATIGQLREVFVHLQSESESGIYNRFEKALRDICGQADLQIGLMPFIQVNGKYVHHTAYTSRSIYLKHSGKQIDEKNDWQAQRIISKLVLSSQPRLTHDLDKAAEPELQFLYQKGFRSFLLYPIVASNQALGILEIGSPHIGVLNGEVLRKLEPIIPMVVELLFYQINHFKTTIEQIIRQKFTSLQPSVEWKFSEAAWGYLQQGEETLENASTQISFPKVYPFYGAIDIRNSSMERNRVLHEDLIWQFRFIGEVLQLPHLSDKREKAQELLVTNQYWQNNLDGTLLPEEEVHVTRFLTKNLHPFLLQLREGQSELANRLQSYFEYVDTNTGFYHKAYNTYEQSMAQINATVNTYIERETKKLRTIFPHYFEKFRTDGLEYNIYCGQSIAPWLPFQPDYLHQFRSWQLTSLVEMAQLTHQLRPLLPLPMQTTQLLLAHSQPVDIKFRLDEQRFDVEGSYSIRYEVIKKRIDKAYIKGSVERLTQPDTIALVYAHTQELDAYTPIIQSLHTQGKLIPGTELVELEPLQGITSLKALRLRIKY